MSSKKSDNAIGVDKSGNSNYKSYFVALLPLLFVACFLYGFRPLLACGVGASSAYVVEFLCVKMRRMPFHAKDVTPLVTGVMLTLLLPANISYWLIVVGAFVAIALAKHAFGGIKNQIFNPVAVAFVFLSVAWPERVYSYPTPLQNLPLWYQSNAPIEMGISPAYTLKRSGVPFFDNLDLFLGNYPGALGATCTVVIVACATYLIVKKVMTWEIPVTFLSTCVIFSFLFPRISTGSFDSVFYEIFCGVLFYGIVFLASDENTIPVRSESKVFFGISLGLLTMFFNYFGAFEIGFCFALIIMNALSGFFDRVFTPFLLDIDWRHTLKEMGRLVKSLVSKVREIGDGEKMQTQQVAGNPQLQDPVHLQQNNNEERLEREDENKKANAKLIEQTPKQQDNKVEKSTISKDSELEKIQTQSVTVSQIKEEGK